MNAITLEMLLKAYYLGDGLSEKCRLQSKAHHEGFKRLKANKLISYMPTRKGFQLTDCGRLFVKMILETPLPIKDWVDPRKKK